MDKNIINAYFEVRVVLLNDITVIKWWNWSCSLQSKASKSPIYKFNLK